MAALSPRELLVQARHLATKEPVQPRQASLRRAVSTAYYALFHLLIASATKSLASTHSGALNLLLARAFAHTEMDGACKAFAPGGAIVAGGNNMPAVIASLYGRGIAVPMELQEVAGAFVALHKAREDADYATHRVWTRTEALTEVERAEQAFTT